MPRVRNGSHSKAGAWSGGSDASSLSCTKWECGTTIWQGCCKCSTNLVQHRQQYVNCMHTTKGCGFGAVELGLGAGGWDWGLGAGTGDLLQSRFDPRSPG